MDNIEITVFDEINDYKEKIYFFNFRQWAFAILIVALVVPTYLLLKDRIGDEITSYIVIAIAGILGFIGFVKIHELPAEKILPYWLRHYLCFAKPIHYITDEEFKMQHQKKGKTKQVTTKKIDKNNSKSTKAEIKELKKKQKQEKLLQKAKKKYGVKENNTTDNKIIEKENKDSDKGNELSEKLSKLTKEQQDALLKLLER